MKSKGNIVDRMRGFDKTGSLWRFWRYVGEDCGLPVSISNSPLEGQEDIDILNRMKGYIEMEYWERKDLGFNVKNDIDVQLRHFSETVVGVRSGRDVYMNSEVVSLDDFLEVKDAFKTISAGLGYLVEIESKLFS